MPGYWKNVDMLTDHAKLAARAFGPGSGALKTVAYLSYQQALQFLLAALRQTRGIGLLQGPAGSGRTTIARRLVAKLAHDTPVAYVDGARLNPRDLLSSILVQFEVPTNAEPDDELLELAAGFAGRQAGASHAPVVVIDNVDGMYPAALRVLNALAGLQARGRHSLRLVLTGGASLGTLVRSDGMQNVARRDPGLYLVRPLTAKESMIYLHARLQAAGADRTETVFPFDVCDRLRELSGGWPAELNRVALDAMQRASELPVGVANTCSPGELETALGDDTRTLLAGAEFVAEDNDIPTLLADGPAETPVPRVIVSRDGRQLGRYTFNERRVLIGRSDFADIVIEDEYVSKLHAILILYADALVLLDLNSANGTTVNSTKVSKTILRTDDVLTLGHHRLKIESAPQIAPEIESLLGAPDTLQMKNLVDLRRLRARRAMRALPGKNRG